LSKDKFLRELTMPFWVYILKCADGSYYTGHTDHLEKRLAEHQTGVSDGYTSKPLPVTLSFSQDFPTRLEALPVNGKSKVGAARRKKH
jgi:predicted GIY-YIG superfamily endonuclease